MENQKELVEGLAAALYRLQWNAELYEIPQDAGAKPYERRARKLLAAGYYKKDLDALAHKAAQRDLLALHRIDHRYDTALHEQCTCGKRWMGGPGKMAAHHAEVLAASSTQETPGTLLCATCDGGGCGDCI